MRLYFELLLSDKFVFCCDIENAYWGNYNGLITINIVFYQHVVLIEPRACELKYTCVQIGVLGAAAPKCSITEDKIKQTEENERK